MLAVASLLIILLASLIVARVATVLLTSTGLAQESARFQARSALTGVGFTTTEAESVVNHPVRRRVVMALMLIGSAGIVTAVASLMLSFAGAEGRQSWTRLALILGGLLTLFLLARSKYADRLLQRAVRWALARWSDLDVRDYASLLHVAGGYTVMELYVEEDDWVAGRTLRENGLRDEGVALLGIVRRGGEYVGSPVGGTRVHAGDTLILYGLDERLCELDRRKRGPAGDEAHRRALEEQAAVLARGAGEPSGAEDGAARPGEKTGLEQQR